MLLILGYLEKEEPIELEGRPDFRKLFLSVGFRGSTFRDR